MTEDRVLLEHMKQAIDRIREYSAIGEEEFLVDTKTQDAVIRNFEVLAKLLRACQPRFATVIPKFHGGKSQLCVTFLHTCTSE